MQGRNGDANIKNKLVDIAGKERVGRIEKVVLTYIHHHV